MGFWCALEVGRGILSCRFPVLAGSHYLIGYVEDTYFWYDPWLPFRSPYWWQLWWQFYAWSWHGKQHQSLELCCWWQVVLSNSKNKSTWRQFPSDIPILLIQNAEFKDEIVWKKSNQGVFTMSSASPTNFQANQQMKWCKMIWFKGNIKKHSVCVLGWPSKMPPKQKQKKFIGLGSLFLTLLMFSVTVVHKDCMHVFTSCTFNRFICDEISKFGVT